MHVGNHSSSHQLSINIRGAYPIFGGRPPPATPSNRPLNNLLTPRKAGALRGDAVRLFVCSFVSSVALNL